jgi:hypothetical protein
MGTHISEVLPEAGWNSCIRAHRLYPVQVDKVNAHIYSPIHILNLNPSAGYGFLFCKGANKTEIACAN